MVILFVVFFLVSFILIPVAWIISIADKVSNNSGTASAMAKMLNTGIFIPLGPVILILDVFVDLIYFWQNNFR